MIVWVSHPRAKGNKAAATTPLGTGQAPLRRGGTSCLPPPLCIGWYMTAGRAGSGIWGLRRSEIRPSTLYFCGIFKRNLASSEFIRAIHGWPVSMVSNILAVSLFLIKTTKGLTTIAPANRLRVAMDQLGIYENNIVDVTKARYRQAVDELVLVRV